MFFLGVKREKFSEGRGFDLSLALNGSPWEGRKGGKGRGEDKRAWEEQKGGRNEGKFVFVLIYLQNWFSAPFVPPPLSFKWQDQQ